VLGSSLPFIVRHSLRVPGLGLLVLPAPPAPAWLAEAALHTAGAFRLHRPGQLPLDLTATLEEVSHDGPPGRALLLDADPGEPLPPGTWLELVALAPENSLW